MKKLLGIILGCISVLALAGCDELINIWTGGGGNSTPIVSYPMHVGNWWTMDHAYVTYNFRPIDTTFQFQPDSFRFINSVEVTGHLRIPRIPGTPGDSITVTEIRAMEAGTSGSSYYTQSAEGLFLHGYIFGALSLPRPQGEQLSFTISGRTFPSLRELTKFMESPRQLYGQDSLTREYPPLTAIRYPLQEGDQWTYRANGMPFRIDKRTGPRRFNRELQLWYHEVRWLYDVNGNGLWDGNISVTDHISARGLLVRRVDIKDIAIVTSSDPEPVGYVDMRDEYRVTVMSVQ